MGIADVVSTRLGREGVRRDVELGLLMFRRPSSMLIGVSSTTAASRRRPGSAGSPHHPASTETARAFPGLVRAGRRRVMPGVGHKSVHKLRHHVLQPAETLCHAPVRLGPRPGLVHEFLAPARAPPGLEGEADGVIVDGILAPDLSAPA